MEVTAHLDLFTGAMFCKISRQTVLFLEVYFFADLIFQRLAKLCPRPFYWPCPGPDPAVLFCIPPAQFLRALDALSRRTPTIDPPHSAAAAAATRSFVAPSSLFIG